MSGFPSAPAYPSSHEFPAMPAMPAMQMPQPYQQSPMPMPMPMHMAPEPPPPVYCPAAPAITIHRPMAFGPESMTIQCPHCNCMVSTETSKTHAACTHCCCLLMFCSVFLSICSCLPYCCCDPETVEHTCPNCHAKLGAWYP